MNPEVNSDILKQKIMPEIKPLEEIVKDEFKEKYPQLWNQIFEIPGLLHLLTETNPNGFTGGYNQKLICNIIGMMSEKGVFSESKNKIDTIIYTDKTIYKYLSELFVGDNNTSCAMTATLKKNIENILSSLS
jgi:hypothetical protein